MAPSPDPSQPAEQVPPAAVQAVLQANQAFYTAFEAADLDAMADVWERTDAASVTHPGWATLHGWARVAASWDAIFRGPATRQFVLTEVRADVVGDVAWVQLAENILETFGPSGPGRRALEDVTIAATNVFVRRDGRWRMVLHHGSPVARGGPA